MVVFFTVILSEQGIQLQSGFEVGSNVSYGYKQQPLRGRQHLRGILPVFLFASMKTVIRLGELKKIFFFSLLFPVYCLIFHSYFSYLCLYISDISMW